VKPIPKNYLLLIIPLLVLTAIGCKNNSPESPGNPPPGDTTVTPPAKPSKTDVHLWLTTPDKIALFQKQNVSLLFSAENDQNPTITVDTAKTYQSIAGFGFALTDASAYLIYNLSKDKRTRLLHNLFSTDSTSIGISYLRISIGASDLSRHVFSYDDMPQGKADTTLQQFDLGPDKDALIPLLKEILSINPGIKILGSPWSAPVWMKTNGSSIGGELDPKYYDVYAQYFVKYIRAMKAKGIKIDAITPQNEPLNPDNNPSMKMTASEEADFIKDALGPAFKKAGINTKIIIWDHNADRPSYPIDILNDADARKYIDGSAFHLYNGSITALSQVHMAYPDKNIYFTEQYTPKDGSFAGDLKWHIKNLIIGAIRNWSKNVIEWNLASEPQYDLHTSGGCDVCKGALMIDNNNISKEVSYYIIASASKFVRPGSKRIASNNVGNLQNVAFQTPKGKKVLIVLNDGGNKQQFDIKFDGKVVTTSLASGAVGTYVWE
jgi:glucosylceramidase